MSGTKQNYDNLDNPPHSHSQSNTSWSHCKRIVTTVLPQGLQFVASCQASTSKRCQFAVLVTRFYVTYPNLPSYLHYFHYPLSSTIATEKPWPEWTQSQRGLNPVWKHTRDGKSGSKIVSQSKSIFRHGVYDCQYGWQEHDEDDGFPLQLKMFHVSGGVCCVTDWLAHDTAWIPC